MIFKEKPENFNPRFLIVSCFCEYKGKILLLKRSEEKPQGLRWGLPAGKIEKNETPEDALLRELCEETCLKLKKDDIKYFGKVYVRYSDYDFIYHIFHAILSQKPEVKISSSEHVEFVWVSPEETLKLSLVQDLDACIKLFYDKA